MVKPRVAAPGERQRIAEATAGQGVRRCGGPLGTGALVVVDSAAEGPGTARPAGLDIDPFSLSTHSKNASPA